MFKNWTWPNFFSRLHDIFVPAALTVAGLSMDPHTAPIVASLLGEHGAAIVTLIGAIAHFGDSQVNNGLPVPPPLP